MLACCSVACSVVGSASLAFVIWCSKLLYGVVNGVVRLLWLQHVPSAACAERSNDGLLGSLQLRRSKAGLPQAHAAGLAAWLGHQS